MIPIDPKNLPRHIAIIMDGNGRWAKKKKMNRIFGHQKGADSVREVVRTSREIGIKWLTLYAFSEENWKRPTKEIKALMGLLKRFLKSELKEMQKNGIRLQAIGRIEKLPQDTRQVLYDTIEKTASNEDLFLTLALSYGGRQEIIDAVKAMGRDLKTRRSALMRYLRTPFRDTFITVICLTRTCSYDRAENSESATFSCGR